MTTNTTGYKAIVCIHLYGGNDGYNWVVPKTPAKYAEYAASRNSVALPQSSVLPLQGTADDGNQYGVNAACPDLQALFNAGKVAVVANQGTLVQPVTAAQVRAGTAALPPRLMSHYDQQRLCMEPQSSADLGVGWAGALADQFQAGGYLPRLPMCTSTTDPSNGEVLTVGARTTSYALGTGGATGMDILGSPNSAACANALYALAASDPNPMVRQFAAVAQSSISKRGLVSSVLAAAGTFKTAVFSTDVFGAQLQVVAEMIKGNAGADARQVYAVGFNGFDFHASLIGLQTGMLAELSAQVQQFYNAMVECGQSKNVLVMTESEFSRSLVPNSNSGTDHAWGGHQMFVGDAVKPGFYGKMPSLALGGPDDFGGGRMVPTTAVEQVANTVAAWFGADPALSAALFPNLKNFAAPTLGFL